WEPSGGRSASRDTQPTKPGAFGRDAERPGRRCHPERGNQKGSNMSDAALMQQRAEEFRKAYGRVQREIGKVIVGHSDIVHGVLNCLFVCGHALLAGVPRIGKTLWVRTLSQVLDLSFNRIQFTPVLMPSDIIG